MAQSHIYRRFAWQAWHSWHGVARLGVVWARGDAAPFCVAGVAQRYIHLRFTWQAWHKLASTFVSRGRRGTHGMGWRAWVWFGRAVTPRHFAWQAWHNVTSTFVSRGRRGTNSHLPSFRVAGVALMAWGGALGCGLGARWRRAILRGRRGTTLHPLAFHVAGVAQTRIYLRSRGRRGTHGMGWRAWVWFGRAVTPRHFAWQAWHNVTSTFVSRGRRGTNSHLPSFRVAGVALMAWGGALGCGLGARWRRAILRGRRGTTLHPPSFHVAGVAQNIHLAFAPPCFRVAGVAQTRIYLRFAWQAWHKLASTFVSRGRRGTHGMGWRAWVWFGRAVTPCHFAWQAWHNLTSTCVSRGRRGTNSHLPSFRVAGVALMAWVGALGCGLGARWRRAILRGRRGATLHPPSFHVAGVAQTRIYLRFAWQAWHKLASTFVSRGRRGTHGMGWRAWVWFGRAVTPRHFAWQAWHNVTSTFVSRGRRGTNSHLPSFRVAGVALMAWGGALGCGLGARWRRAILRGRRGTTLHPPSFHVAGVAQTDIHLAFAWQAWHSWHGVARLGVVWARGDAAPFCVAGVAERYIHLRFTWQAWHKLTFTLLSRGRRGNHVLLAARPIVDPLWEDWGRDGQIKTVRDMCRVCPTAGRSATGLVRILITAKMWHLCSRLNCIVSAHVALIASSIYAFCPFAARYFSALLQSMPTTAGCAADLYQRTILFCGFALITPRHFAWQAWHNLTSTFVSRGRCGTNWHPPCFRVAGVAQTRIYLRFAWQAWHKLASTFVSRGRRGTHGMGWRAWVWFGRAVTPRHFAWQAWHNLTSTCISRGRRGTNSHLPSFRLAGVALMAWVGALGCGLGARWRRAILRGRRGTTLHPPFVSRGRRGTNSHLPSFRVASVAQTRIYLRFTWQAWHSWHGVARLGVVWARGDAAPFCVAGVAQRYIHLRFTWQAWHKFASTFVSRGRRGTHGMGWRAWVWFGRAVAPRHFAWQAWHNLTSTFVSRGRCGINWHPPCFRVAGVALMAWGGALGCGLGARWRRAILRGRRGRTLHPPSFHVAGVAQTDIHLAFAWQAWQSCFVGCQTHCWPIVGRLGSRRPNQNCSWHV